MSNLVGIGLDLPSTGTVAWAATSHAAMNRLDQVGSAALVVLTAAAGIVLYDAVYFVPNSGGAAATHVAPADLGSLAYAEGIALTAGGVGDPILVLRRGVLQVAAGEVAWSGIAAGDPLFLGAAGTMVSAEDDGAAVGSDGDVFVRQRVLTCLTEGDFERYLVEPEQPTSLKHHLVGSSRFVQVSGAAAAESFNNVSGTRWETVVTISDNATKVFAFAFVVPTTFRGFNNMRSEWAFKVGYIVTGNCAVQATAWHAGAGAKTVIAPTNGTSTSWANYSVIASIFTVAPVAGSVVYVEVTVTGNSGTCKLATNARLRFAPVLG